MKKKITTYYSRMLADTHTPVSVYLALRDRFACSLLLESSDYHGTDNSYSYICCDPLFSYELSENKIQIQNHGDRTTAAQEATDVPALLQSFINGFVYEEKHFPFDTCGWFGYTAYDAVQHFEDIQLNAVSAKKEIPLMVYRLFRYVLVFDHFNETLHLFQHETETGVANKLQAMMDVLQNRNLAKYNFELAGDVATNLTDEQFRRNVASGKQHCQRGDVFQVVLSREFNVSFRGDEFNVYRALRSINPSPYLFYFDLGSFKIFGSSPEAQLVVKNRTAEIHPIAGTFRRTGDDEADAALARRLEADEKENAEHVMLVDWARNDLSRACRQVQVERFREVQYFSHVIHLVSKVTGRLRNDVSAAQIAADTFPAGTLSGAPKHRAMQIIDELENDKRGYYGGCIGFYGLNGSFNHAIIIRSFLSLQNKLYWRAGAGVVKDSSEEGELQEVNNKLAALRKALEVAQTF